jgi:hypothetical protein
MIDMSDKEIPVNGDPSAGETNRWHFEGQQVPQPVVQPNAIYVCPACKKEHSFPEDWNFMSYYDQSGKMLTSTGPLCIYCLASFLKQNVPAMVIKERLKP